LCWGRQLAFFINKFLAPPEDEFAGLLHPSASEDKKHEEDGQHKSETAEADCEPVAVAGGEHGASAGEHGAEKKGGSGKPPCGPKKKRVEVEPEFATTYHELPGPFTANLKNSRRFIQVALALSTQYDEQVINNVKAHEPALKGAIIATLADCTEQDIVGIEAKQHLADRLRDAINEVLVKKTRFGGIEEVHFTSFVTQ